MALSPDDKAWLSDAIHDAVERKCMCPNGITPDMAKDVRDFIGWWKESKKEVGRAAVKAFVWIVMIIVAAYSWFSAVSSFKIGGGN